MISTYKLPSALTISEAGIELLRQFEGEVRGIYNDSVGYATFGIGSLVGNKQNTRNSILLRVARGSHELARKYIKIYSKTRAPYLEASASKDPQFASIVTDLMKRTNGEAKIQLDNEWALLRMDWNDYLGKRFKDDVEARAKVVRCALGSTKITQNQFDGLISMAYNVLPEKGFWVVFKAFADADRAYEEKGEGSLQKVDARAAAFMSRILVYAHAKVTRDVISGWHFANGEIRSETFRVEPYYRYDLALSKRRQLEGAHILGPRFSECNRVCATVRISRAVYIVAGENNAATHYDAARAKLYAARAAAKPFVAR